MVVAATFNGTLNSLPSHSLLFSVVNFQYGLETRFVSSLGSAVPDLFVTLWSHSPIWYWCRMSMPSRRG